MSEVSSVIIILFFSKSKKHITLSFIHVFSQRAGACGGIQQKDDYLKMDNFEPVLDDVQASHDLPPPLPPRGR